MIVVRIWWNTDHKGQWVQAEKLDPDSKDTPQCIFGPFNNVEDAHDWMAHGYPEDDTDVWDMEVDENFELPEGWSINHPSVVFDGFTKEWRQYLRARRVRLSQRTA